MQEKRLLNWLGDMYKKFGIMNVTPLLVDIVPRVCPRSNRKRRIRVSKLMFYDWH